ncbi:1,4-dihydroxy-2-naphthoate octaprenyltransferase [uncultured archaeon]|nr:1,4-dihydroxy-2-naphthoate octaprenyltransferase [uncultured archaeon]
MWFKKYVELLKLCGTPPSIVSPLPIFSVSLFLISNNNFYNIYILLAGIVLTLLSSFGSNLWNHCNDLKEDMAAGKKTILTSDAGVNKAAHVISFMLYVCSILLAYYLSVELRKPIYIFFSIWAFLTWWYSDNLFLKKVTGFRLKDHYISEFITYGIGCPFYTLSIWLIYSDLNLNGLIISIAFFFFSISGLLLKDLKDISGDKSAGLKNLGVVFLPSQLIRYSCWFMILFYLALLNPLTLSLFNNGFLVIMLPFLYFLKNTFHHMYKKNWILDMGDLKALRGIGTSIKFSVIFLGLSAFF